MSYNKRNKGVLADSQYNDQEDADRETGHDIRIDDRNLIQGINHGTDLSLRIKCTDGSHRSEYRRKQGRYKSKHHGSDNHISELGSRKKRHIIMKRETSDCSDIGSVRKTVNRENQDRCIQNHEHEQYENSA